MPDALPLLELYTAPAFDGDGESGIRVRPSLRAASANTRHPSAHGPRCRPEAGLRPEATRT